MALLVCPECKKEVSDQAKVCPNCGYPFSIDESTEPGAVAGVLETAIETKKSKKPLVILSIVAILAVVGICAGLLIYQNMVAKARADYIENLGLARDYMLQGGVEAESTCNLIKAVWYNTIYEEFDRTTNKYTMNDRGYNSDFNDSLQALFGSDEYKNSISTITASQDLVEDQMKKLQSPPDNLRDCYETLNDMYGEFTELTSLATNPSGSLQSYSDSFNSCEKNFMKHYDKFNTQIPGE